MSKYKEAYQMLLRETDKVIGVLLGEYVRDINIKAVDLLVDAQQKCEELFLADDDDSDDDDDDEMRPRKSQADKSFEELFEFYELLEKCRLEMEKKSLAKERKE